MDLTTIRRVIFDMELVQPENLLLQIVRSLKSIKDIFKYWGIV